MVVQHVTLHKTPKDSKNKASLFDIPEEIFTGFILPALTYTARMNFSLSLNMGRTLVGQWQLRQSNLNTVRMKEDENYVYVSEAEEDTF